MELKIEPLLVDLVKRNVITLTFVDTPIHRETTLYVRYFLFALNQDAKLDNAIRVRHALFEAASNNITGQEKLEGFLREKRVRFKPYEPSAVFKVFTTYLMEDNIRQTPVCVIQEGQKREIFKGPLEIPKALQLIKARRKS